MHSFNFVHEKHFAAQDKSSEQCDGKAKSPIYGIGGPVCVLTEDQPGVQKEGRTDGLPENDCVEEKINHPDRQMVDGGCFLNEQVMIRNRRPMRTEKSPDSKKIEEVRQGHNQKPESPKQEESSF